MSKTAWLQTAKGLGSIREQLIKLKSVCSDDLAMDMVLAQVNTLLLMAKEQAK